MGMPTRGAAKWKDQMLKREHRTLNDRAYQEIRRNLARGKLKPGEAVVIRTLAAEFGISATPVRDALLRLVAEKMLVLLPNRSFGVPVLALDSYVELTRIRAVLEGMAGELATEHTKLALIHQLHQLIEQGEAAAAARDSVAYTAVNQQFHFAIYEQAQSPILFQKINELWTQVGPFFSQLLDDAAYVPLSNAPHRAILAALEARDGARVKEAIVRDIELAAASLTKRLQLSAAGPEGSKDDDLSAA